jgi:hypothetical protein
VYSSPTIAVTATASARSKSRLEGSRSQRAAIAAESRPPPTISAIGASAVIGVSFGVGARREGDGDPAALTAGTADGEGVLVLAAPEHRAGADSVQGPSSQVRGS